MATITLDYDLLVNELTRRGMTMAELGSGPNRVSTNVLAAIRAGKPIRQDTALKIAIALEERRVHPMVAAILPAREGEAQ